MLKFIFASLSFTLMSQASFAVTRGESVATGSVLCGQSKGVKNFVELDTSEIIECEMDAAGIARDNARKSCPSLSATFLNKSCNTRNTCGILDDGNFSEYVESVCQVAFTCE